MYYYIFFPSSSIFFYGDQQQDVRHFINTHTYTHTGAEVWFSLWNYERKKKSRYINKLSDYILCAYSFNAVYTGGRNREREETATSSSRGGRWKHNKKTQG